MSKFFSAVIIVFCIIFITRETCACQPCTAKLDFDETLKASDLVVIGRRVGEYPSPEMALPNRMGPDWIRIEVLEILKGYCPNRIIKVNSFNGMCPYGIVIEDDNKHIFFLQKAHVDYLDYDSVNNGCAVKTLAISDDQVEYQGKLISLKIFKLIIQPLVEGPHAEETGLPLPAGFEFK